MAGGHGGAHPSRTTASELHQATTVPYQVTHSSPPEPSSTSQDVTPQVEQQFQQLALRPGKCSVGKKCIVKANHFVAQLSAKDLYQYEVTITPDVQSRAVNLNRAVNRAVNLNHAVNRAVIRQLVTLHGPSYLGGHFPVYDGRKWLYTAGPLPFTSKNFVITLPDEEDGLGSQRRERPFKVDIKFAAYADLRDLGLFLSGRQADAPEEALQVLNTLLRQLPTERCTPVGRSFYMPDARRQSLGKGLESWRGFHQSIRPTQMGLSLNLDISSTVFIEAIPVVDFVAKHLNRSDISTLSHADHVKIKRALRGVKVEVTHRGSMRRKYRITDVTSLPTSELTFLVHDQGTMMPVIQYYQETYGFNIQHPTLPCLQVASKNEKPTYLPMEVCKIVEGQRYFKRLSEKQITALLRPNERENNIKQTVRQNAYTQDPYAREFGMTIAENLTSVEARILPAPRLKYHDTGKEKDCLPRDGQWNMRNKKMVDGGRVSNWICINFSKYVEDSAAWEFCRELAITCQASGMDFALEPVLPPLRALPVEVKEALTSQFLAGMDILEGRGKELYLDLLIVILPDRNGSLYGDVKRICETDLGLVSQCCLTKYMFPTSKQYLANLALKINTKVGGRNTVLMDALAGRIPLVTDCPTIIFGADVTHPGRGEDSSPSIAAVVASQDWPEVTKYAGLLSAQARNQELIADLRGMTRELLISFKEATGHEPRRIIFYRDGVGDSQFHQVLSHELSAIREACHLLEYKYQPPITFFVVQKRHHTRLFPDNYNDPRFVGNKGNILPGTVVDSKICDPTGFDFFLCSHPSMKGTSRPAHYRVLWDENGFSSDEVQTFTNNLCYTYARCTRSVSIVPPVYYAHLAAYRARFYVVPETSDGGSIASTSSAVARGTPAGGPRTTMRVRPLPPLKENIKRAMFYC